MTDKDAVTLRNLEDAARQFLATEAELDAMLRYGDLEYEGKVIGASYRNASYRRDQAKELMHATLKPTGQ